MCASGLPHISEENAIDAVRAGIAIRNFMKKYNQEKRELGKETFEIRIGIHSGPVVAGVVGIKKFAYDIWGDTVNTASRMESSGEIGKVNISGATHNLIKDLFVCTYRGKIQAKNKGEIDMYFVEDKI
jgi:class 3 adenylate cyclase